MLLLGLKKTKHITTCTVKGKNVERKCVALTNSSYDAICYFVEKITLPNVDKFCLLKSLLCCDWEALTWLICLYQLLAPIHQTSEEGSPVWQKDTIGGCIIKSCYIYSNFIGLNENLFVQHVLLLFQVKMNSWPQSSQWHTNLLRSALQTCVVLLQQMDWSVISRH